MKSLLQEEKVVIEGSKFERCESETGGAIYLYEIKIEADTNIFNYNVANTYIEGEPNRRLQEEESDEEESDQDIAQRHIISGEGAGGGLYLYKNLPDSHIRNS